MCLTKSTPKNEYKQYIKMVRYSIAFIYTELVHKAINTLTHASRRSLSS